MASSKYAELAAQLEAIAKDPPAELLQDDQVRKRLMDASHAIIPQIEAPGESFLRVIYTPLELMAAQIGVNLRLFEMLSKEKTLSTATIAERVGGDSILLDRLLRYIASVSYIKEVDVGLWGATQITNTFAEPGVQGGIFNHFYTLGPTWLDFPAFLEKTKYQSIPDPQNCPFTASHEGASFFEFLGKNPANARHFDLFMTSKRIGLPDWRDHVPFKDFITDEDIAGNRPLFVDIGGGKGHQCEAVLQRHPELAGRVILEDQPSVLEGALSVKGMEKVPLDFFKEQPVKGSKIYYIRNVLHNWPDDKTHIILSHVKESMAPDSLLLINECVVPTKNADKFTMQLDMLIYCCFGSEQRTEKRFADVLDGAGFKIDNIYTFQEKPKNAILATSLKSKPIVNGTA